MPIAGRAGGSAERAIPIGTLDDRIREAKRHRRCQNLDEPLRPLRCVGHFSDVLEEARALVRDDATAFSVVLLVAVNSQDAQAIRRERELILVLVERRFDIWR